MKKSGQRMFYLSRISNTLAAIFIGLALEYIILRINEEINWTTISIFALCTIFFAILSWQLHKKTQKFTPTAKIIAQQIDPIIGTKITPKKGMILLLSPLRVKEKFEAIKSKKPYSLSDIPDLKNTNLGHTIKAIETYLGYDDFKHIWVVASLGFEDSGSAGDVKVLIEYFQKNHESKKIEWHHFRSKNESVATINTENQEKITEETKDLINDLYSKAKDNHGLRDEDIILEMTGGKTEMKIGAVLAALKDEREIQYITTNYDENGPNLEKSKIVKIEFNVDSKVIDK